jgi:hypothetical protein
MIINLKQYTRRHNKYVLVIPKDPKVSSTAWRDVEKEVSCYVAAELHRTVVPHTTWLGSALSASNCFTEPTSPARAAASNGVVAEGVVAVESLILTTESEGAQQQQQQQQQQW